VFLIENLYNGLYFKNGKGNCLDCVREGFKRNTDISRLKALDFHHETKIKKYEFSSKTLFELFNKNICNLNFLDDLIRFLEANKVVLICSNHHMLISSKYYELFKSLISWIGIPGDLPQDIFSLEPELIHTLTRVSIENHPDTRFLSQKKKSSIKLSIISLLKRRYIIENFYGRKCHICKEFNTIEHLVSFHFHHQDKTKKTTLASDIYSTESITCSEIVKTLEKEEGGYICANCHYTLHNKPELLEQIHDDKEILKKAKMDYNDAINRFNLIFYKTSLKNPLNLSKRLSHNFRAYLIAIDEISRLGQIATNKTIANQIGVSGTTTKGFFIRNNYMAKFLDINKQGKTHLYSLNNLGKMTIQLINHFENFYGSP